MSNERNDLPCGNPAVNPVVKPEREGSLSGSPQADLNIGIKIGEFIVRRLVKPSPITVPIEWNTQPKQENT